MAKNKIKRRVTIDGELVWITAETEQEYSEKIICSTPTDVQTVDLPV